MKLGGPGEPQGPRSGLARGQDPVLREPQPRPGAAPDWSGPVSRPRANGGPGRTEASARPAPQAWPPAGSSFSLDVRGPPGPRGQRAAPRPRLSPARPLACLLLSWVPARAPLQPLPPQTENKGAALADRKEGRPRPPQPRHAGAPSTPAGPPALSGVSAHVPDGQRAAEGLPAGSCLPWGLTTRLRQHRQAQGWHTGQGPAAARRPRAPEEPPPSPADGCAEVAPAPPSPGG